MATGVGGPDGLEGGGFSILDPKLTIFALANGMDLEKAPSTRKLTWFRDGLERGLLLSASADGQVSVTALAWKRGDETSERSAPCAPDAPEAEVAEGMTSILERAVDAANAL